MVVRWFSDIIFLLSVTVTSGEQCPTLPGQLGEPTDLDITTVSAFLSPEDFEFLTSNFYFIEDGATVSPFNSLEAISDPLVVSFLSSTLPQNISSIPLQLEVAADGEDSLYYSIYLYSSDQSVAPSGCPTPQLDVIQTNETIDIDFSCNSHGTAIQQVCLTVGTEPFHILNGTYHTFSFYLPLVCTSPSEPVCSIAPILLAEMCITPNNSIALVQSGEGSWGLLASILRPSDQAASEGYCIIDEENVPPGVIALLLDDSINLQYAIPSQFDYLEVFFVISQSLPLIPLSYSISPVSDNLTVLSHPLAINGVPLQGVVYDGRVDFIFDLTCKNPGHARIFINFNVSAIVNEIVYSNTYPDLYFYRNCSDTSNGTVVIINNSDNLGLKVGIPLAVLFLLLVVIATISLFLMLYFTRKHRHKAFELEQEHQLQLLASSNAYIKYTFENEMQSLDEHNMEYNYTSLEIVDELGEGAFGHVFKAYAPGLEFEGLENNNFVAVKMLKEEADADALLSFISEVKISVQFRHPNVVQLIGVCTQSHQKCMIFEYMDLGSLNDVLRQSDPDNPSKTSHEDSVIRPENFLSCCLQVASGLAYLATLKFVHRDIATRNCLIDSNFVVKIADFGMSRELSTDYYTIGSASACLPVRWMPPEALLYGKFTVKSDVWSYGVLMWEIFTYAHQPYGGISNFEVIDRIKEGRILECPDTCPAAIYDIMKTCWTRVPQKRPMIATILTRIGHLLRSNSMGILEDYSIMGPNEGYLNLNFGTVVEERELEEKRRVDDILNKVQRKGGEVVSDQIRKEEEPQDEEGRKIEQDQTVNETGKDREGEHIVEIEEEERKCAEQTTEEETGCAKQMEGEHTEETGKTVYTDYN